MKTSTLPIPVKLAANDGAVPESRTPLASSPRVAARRLWIVSVCSLLLSGIVVLAADAPVRHPLDPRGQIHIPIGIPNTLDSLKTFVEAEGNFSPGFGSYGIYFWVWMDKEQKLFAPTMDGAKCEHGLGPDGALIPWSRWNAGEIEVKTEVCEVERQQNTNTFCVVGARAHVANRGTNETKLSLFAALRPLGPAGFAVDGIGFSGSTDVLAVTGFPALVANEKPAAVGALTNDTIGEWAWRGELPKERYVSSNNGGCSGAMRFDLTLAPGQTRTLGFTCPVLPNRRAVGHQWDGASTWAQLDLSRPNPKEGGALQLYPGLGFYRRLKADAIFAEAAAFWSNFLGRTSLQLPDPRWAESFNAIVAHSALCMNEGAPDVAVVNYNVYNRDGMYLANIFQKSGHFELAELAIGYFLKHPFNGRVQPEADNPGQILWIMGEHWKFTRDQKWLEHIYPAALKIAAMISYYRTTPGPHYVGDTSLEFGDALPKNHRKELKPGACDGYNPNYTEAYDIAGLRGAVTLAEAMEKPEEAASLKKLIDELSAIYHQKFGTNLAKGYGSYSVLWPCRLYPLNEGPGHEQFKNIGAQHPASWRYFPLARAHQGLLAGNRAAAFETLNIHLAHEQMRGWYAFDEGGPSGVGGWHHLGRFGSWRMHPKGEGNHEAWSVAMPHGWAIAEFVLLLRDALVFEDGDKLVLFGGVPPEWFTHSGGMNIGHLPTLFGKCSLSYVPEGNGATLKLSGEARPPQGFVVRLPPALNAKASNQSQELSGLGKDELKIAPGVREVRFEFAPAPPAKK